MVLLQKVGREVRGDGHSETLDHPHLCGAVRFTFLCTVDGEVDYDLVGGRVVRYDNCGLVHDVSPTT